MPPKPLKPRTAPAYRVKPRSRNSSVRFAKLKALACFKDVHTRILEGWPLSQIAKFIQVDRKEYTDVTGPSLVSVLAEYRSTIPAGTLIKQTPLSPIYNKAADTVEDGLDELAELDRLYEIQLKRINIDLANEEKIKKLLPSMTPEIRAAKDILMARAQLKMDLGLTDRHLGTAEVEVNVAAEAAQKFGSPTVKQVLESDESRRKLLGIAERVLSVSKSKRADAIAGLGQKVGAALTPDDLPEGLDKDPGAVSEDDEVAA